MKGVYRMLIRDKFTGIQAIVHYDFIFQKSPLDCSNCVAMVKLVEDCIFDDDGYKVVKSISISSNKGDRDCLNVTIFDV